MAIFGIGAFYDRDVSGEFLEHGCACVGWAEADAPPAHAILHHLRGGDVIFIKSFTPNAGLTIKAVGLVRRAGAAYAIGFVPNRGSAPNVGTACTPPLPVIAIPIMSC